MIFIWFINELFIKIIILYYYLFIIKELGNIAYVHIFIKYIINNHIKIIYINFIYINIYI